MEPIDEDFAEIDLETLNRCFYDGDIITLNGLKEHGLIKGGNALRIIAKGSLNKRLYIFADAFEPLAVKMLLTTNGSAIEIVRDKYEIIPAPSYYDTIERKPKNNNSSSYSSNSSNSYSSNNSSNNSSSYSSNSSNGYSSSYSSSSYSSSYSYIDWEEVWAKIINIFALVAIPIIFILLMVFYVRNYNLLEEKSFPINLSFLADAWANVPSNPFFWVLGFIMIGLAYLFVIGYIIGEDAFLYDDFKGGLIGIIIVAVLAALATYSLVSARAKDGYPALVGLVRKEKSDSSASSITITIKNTTGDSITYLRGEIYFYDENKKEIATYNFFIDYEIKSLETYSNDFIIEDNYPLYSTGYNDLTATYKISLVSYNFEEYRHYYDREPEEVIKKEA